MRKWLLLIVILVFVAGCRGYTSPISGQADYDLHKPIDCSRAREDIGILEQEKAQSSEQLKAGVKMFVPASAARAILHRDYLDRAEVATGEYNQVLEDKIVQIRKICYGEE
ncbi:MAG: hypothetical protein WCY12_05405 [Candidatus Omnitrophota bacterium]|jgi:hypothetical protein